MQRHGSEEADKAARRRKEATASERLPSVAHSGEQRLHLLRRAIDSELLLVEQQCHHLGRAVPRLGQQVGGGETGIVEEYINV